MARLLSNRVYKGVKYSGTSDRGGRHDPQTRAGTSGEHWRKHCTHEGILQMAEDIRFDRLFAGEKRK